MFKTHNKDFYFEMCVDNTSKKKKKKRNSRADIYRNFKNIHIIRIYDTGHLLVV